MFAAKIAKYLPQRALCHFVSFLFRKRDDRIQKVPLLGAQFSLLKEVLQTVFIGMALLARHCLKELCDFLVILLCIAAWAGADLVCNVVSSAQGTRYYVIHFHGFQSKGVAAINAAVGRFLEQALTNVVLTFHSFSF